MVKIQTSVALLMTTQTSEDLPMTMQILDDPTAPQTVDEKLAGGYFSRVECMVRILRAGIIKTKSDDTVKEECMKHVNELANALHGSLPDKRTSNTVGVLSTIAENSNVYAFLSANIPGLQSLENRLLRVRITAYWKLVLELLFNEDWYTIYRE